MRAESIRQLRLAALAVLTLAMAHACAGSTRLHAADGGLTAEPALCRAQRLEGEQRWDEALRLYRQLASAEDAGAEVRDRIEFCRIHRQIARRYAAPGYLRFASRLDAADAAMLLRRTYSLVGRHYYKDATVAGQVRCGIRQMRLALDNRQFRQAASPSFSAHATAAAQTRLTAFEAALGGPALNASEASVTVGRLCADLGRRLDVPASVLVIEFACAACEGLDSHSTFLSPEDLGDARAVIDGKFVGVGVELETRDGRFVVARIVPGSPADKAGVRAGDRLVGLDGQDVRAWSMAQLGARLRGPVGSPVRLTVTRAGAARPITVALRRALIVMHCVRDARLVDRAAGIGYIHLASFQEDTPSEMTAAVDSLLAEGMRGLILDLRGNPGGLLSAAVRVADLFVDRGVLVSTRGRTWSQNWVHRAHARATHRDLPLVVLVDRQTASAAEIVAGAIADHRRGMLVGESTYGKASVQTLFELAGGAAGLRLTTAVYLTPNGAHIEHRGVHPDVSIPLAPGARFGYTEVRPGGAPDDQLCVGVEQLRRRMTLAQATRL